MDPLEGWNEFNVAMAGATAALAGLVIVAASVNIERIVKTSTLTSRLGAVIATLVLAVVVAGAGLIPGIGGLAYGIVVVVLTAIAAVFQVHASVRIIVDADQHVPLRIPAAAAGAVPLLAYLVGGILVALAAPAGMLLVAAGCLSAIVWALLMSWVVLVEVLR